MMDIRQLFKIRSNTLDPKPGNLLLSEPTMSDYHFGRSVVLLIDHNDKEGTFGVIMNKKLKVRLNEIVDGFDGFDELDVPVYLGGPVATSQIFFMHTLGALIPESFPVMDGLYWGGDAEALDSLIATGVADPRQIRFFLGYSGWSSGQLVSELSRNSWVVGQTDSDTLLGTPTDIMWSRYVERMGNACRFWNHFPKNIQDN